MEIELKLLCDPAASRRIGASTVLREAQRSAPVVRTLRSIYFDTPELALARAGFALRVRRVGRRWIQTLKSGGGVGTGLHQREEHEVPVRAPVPELDALPDTPAVAWLRDPAIRAALAPAFETRFRRNSRTVEIHPGSFAEFALDTGTIDAGGRTEPIHELEIELVDGDARHLYAFARRLLADIDFRIGDVSKAERGYALLVGAAPSPVRGKAPLLDAGMGATAMLRAIVDNCAAHLQANVAGVLDAEDPEYIHQARVAMRRLRSAFSVFRPVVPRESLGEIAGRFRDLAAALGSARDWDVFHGETLPAIWTAFPGEAALARVAEVTSPERDRARTLARAALAPAVQTALMLDLAMLMEAAPWRGADEAGGTTLAGRLLQRQYRRVRKAGRAADRSNDASLHALRIEIKKLRYALEFLSSLYPRKAVRGFANAAADLQDVLGSLNDEAVTLRLLASIDVPDTQLSHGTGIIRGFLHARAHASLDRFETAWRRFSKTDPFW